MSNNNNIPSYNFTHISSYVNGTMSREDMYAFEKAMHADPFLEDAVEGYRTANISKAETDLAAIKAALLPEKETAKIIPFYTAYKTWFSAAAAIIVISTIGAVTFAILKPSNNNQQVAIVTPTIEKSKAFADTTHAINNSPTIANNKPTPTIALSRKQPVIVADKEVVLSLAQQETVSSLQDDAIKKVDSTSLYVGSSVAKLTEKELNSMPPISVEQALQGRVAGIDLKKNSKKYIGPSNTNNGFVNTNDANNLINIRGTNSINKNQLPLYIINGLPYDSLPSYVDGNNIKKIEILKDSTATAMYGARAANGVIVVTTNNQAAELLAKQNAASKAKDIDNLSKSIAANNALKSLRSKVAAPVKDTLAEFKTNLNEVVVIGYGTAKKRDITGSVAKVAIDPLDSLMPVGGWQYYSKYMNQKIGFIGDTTSNNHFIIRDKTGNKLDDIDIEFSVDKEGNAYNVKVITDIDTTKAKTIVNAVVEGPKWISRKKKNKVKIPLKTP
jgi:TonB-dependent SusC/RagA subfamily outer membrane receptor